MSIETEKPGDLDKRQIVVSENHSLGYEEQLLKKKLQITNSQMKRLEFKAAEAGVWVSELLSRKQQSKD